MIALVASFVPAPIALDVILTAILFNIGMRADYAMVALIGLGSFSIYAFIILWRAISMRTAAAIWAAVIGIAVIGGVVANLTTPFVDRYYTQQQRLALHSVEKIDWPIPAKLPPAKTLAELAPLLKSQAVTATPVSAGIVSSQGSTVSISVANAPAALQPSHTKADRPAFTRIVGTNIGLAEKGVNSPLRELGFNMFSGGLAAGDVHNDGWVDIITRRPEHANGLSLYANIGGQFERQQLDLGPVDSLPVFNLALADVDGDARLDLLVSTIGGGDYLFFNEGMGFSKSNMEQINPAGHAVTASFAFADMDRDGDIDIINGRWAPRGVAEGWSRRPEEIRNQILWNEGSRKYRRQLTPGIPGQTFVTMIADFDGDGIDDLFNGDDAGKADGVSFFAADGSIRKTPLSAQPFPYHTRASMSYDEGDWNNDLRPDYYGVQISLPTGTRKRDSKSRVLHAICSQFAADIGWSKSEINRCAQKLLSIDSIRNGKSGKTLDGCTRPSSQQDRALCGASALFFDLEDKKRSRNGDKARYDLCMRELAHIPQLQNLCRSLLFKLSPRPTPEEFARLYRPTLQDGNLLLTSQADGSFTDMGALMQVRSPGWGWNSRFFDLDQDGWQDILVMTGIWLNSAQSTTNVFYRNTGGGSKGGDGSFADATDQFGFHDVIPSFAYVNLDYDRDGDVDVIRDNASMRMIVHRNDRPAGKALVVSLRDSKANRMGIGARVTICTDGQTIARPGKCQMRTLRAGGGFMSSNPISAHFGLGKAKSISLIEVRWPDGEVSIIRPTDLASGEIRIGRD